MKVVALYCPNCGAPVGKDAKFCSQCGSPIVIDDGVKRSEHTYRKVDEARIREAEATQLIRLKEIELERLKQLEEAKEQKRIAMFPIIFLLVFFGICVPIVMFFALNA